MSNISQKRNAFKVEIRRKKVSDKIAQLRAQIMQRNIQLKQSQVSEQYISGLVKETLVNKQTLMPNISKVKSASFFINQQNCHLFFPLIKEFCYILGNIQDILLVKQIKDKDSLFNQIVITLINISSNQAYKWPVTQYLPIIKNLLVKEREINTMWLLSNILYQKQSKDTQESLTKELIKYDCLTFCEKKLNSKFENEEDIIVFACFTSSFLSNGQFLQFNDYKKILKILENLSEVNSDGIDWFIVESMVDNAPYLNLFNYELLYSPLMKNYQERYVKKKKTKMIDKFLQFLKIYITSQLQRSLNESNEIIDKKMAKSNYERISQIVIPNLTICLENRSPQIRAHLNEICCIFLKFYFPYIDLEHQEIYVSLAGGLATTSTSILSKYSTNALTWQLRLINTLLSKIKQFKVEDEIVSQFLSSSNMLEALATLLKDKIQEKELVQQIVWLLYLLVEYGEKGALLKEQKQKNQKTQFTLHLIKDQLEIFMNSSQIRDEEFDKQIQVIIQACQGNI